MPAQQSPDAAIPEFFITIATQDSPDAMRAFRGRTDP